MQFWQFVQRNSISGFKYFQIYQNFSNKTTTFLQHIKCYLILHANIFLLRNLKMQQLKPISIFMMCLFNMKPFQCDDLVWIFFFVFFFFVLQRFHCHFISSGKWKSEDLCCWYCCLQLPPLQLSCRRIHAQRRQCCDDNENLKQDKYFVIFFSIVFFSFFFLSGFLFHLQQKYFFFGGLI